VKGSTRTCSPTALAVSLLYPNVLRLHPDPRHTLGLAGEEVVDNLVVGLTQSELNAHLGPPNGA
jgi:hypothetical protein